MQIKKALREHSNGDDAADENRPHEQAAFLDVIDHANLLDLFAGRIKTAVAFLCRIRCMNRPR